MSIEDQQMLCDKLLAILPKTDSANYINTLKQVDWSKVAFGGFSAEVCQQQWSIMLAKVSLQFNCLSLNAFFFSHFLKFWPVKLILFKLLRKILWSELYGSTKVVIDMYG